MCQLNTHCFPQTVGKRAGDPPRTLALTPAPDWGHAVLMRNEQRWSLWQVILSLPTEILSWSAEHQPVQAHSPFPPAQATSRLCPSKTRAQYFFQVSSYFTCKDCLKVMGVFNNFKKEKVKSTKNEHFMKTRLDTPPIKTYQSGCKN